MQEHMQELLSNPQYAQEYQKRQLKFEAVQARSASKAALCSNPVVLPIAIHYQGIGSPDQACLVALAQNQVDILNNDYHGTSSDISNWTSGSSSFFPGVSNGETCVEFCLATNSHPAGYGLTEGQPAVTINTTSGDFNSDWSGYINVWVRNISGLGYSPLGGSGNGDGVAVDITAFGSGPGCSGVVPGVPYHLGRTLTHELGHFMNLSHIWGGGCGADDGVADTPDSSGPYFGCPTNGVASCGSTDMHMSFMDYSDDPCMYMFSAGQSTRMENWVSAALGNVAANANTTCGPPPAHCTNGIQDEDETGVDCGGADCGPCPCITGTIIYLPNVLNSGPAVILCDTEPAPANYTAAGNQTCAQSTIDADPFCLETSWDGICQDAYNLCIGSSPTCTDGIQNGNETGVDCGGPDCGPCECATGTIIYLPNVLNSGPAVILCDTEPAPANYTAAADQACAQSTIDADPYCLTDFWDGICQDAYNACAAQGCQVPSDLAVVEIGFGNANPSVNATWTNPEGTAYCEVRGGRISNASYTAGEPEFANIANTRIITNTNGSTVNFNIALYNNPNIPFAVGARYGYEVRCDCSDGSGLSGWANITPASTFVVPAPPAGVEVSNGKLLDAGLLEMSIYPNPADAIVNVEIELVEEGSVDIQIFNAVGQLVMQERNSGAKANVRMDVSDLEAGLYIMSVRTDIGVVTKRLVIE
jgi:hypothetical protein